MEAETLRIRSTFHPARKVLISDSRSSRKSDHRAWFDGRQPRAFVALCFSGVFAFRRAAHRLLLHKWAP